MLAVSAADHIDAVIRVYDDAGNVIETHQHTGEGDLWRNVDEFIALFSKAKHGDPYRVEFRLAERLM